ncbi:MAG: TlpA family protein disulfide reductase [Candidatus Cyclonatronum sp.]|uniref:TlpA family protein disulfide reductase n=1 Tax=Cyclonatronum sp. TaxID=3024185 RepID=UPI0025C654C8|nr:TlpA disulfide reductase family protein [Cyclonatronum sp.]MCH8486546.1 TlpA family protein disulfide reductase [Cyclonatronum sp.]
MMAKINDPQTPGKKSRRTMIGLALGFALLIMLGATGGLKKLVLSTGLFDSPPPTEISGPFITDEIRAVPLATADGDTLRLADFDNQVVLLTYWASWCATCRQTNPTIETLSRDLAHRNDIAFLLLSMDNVQESALRYLEGGRFTIPNVFPGAPLPSPLQGASVPTPYVLNRQGQIVYRHTGYANYSTRAFREWVEEVADRDA